MREKFDRNSSNTNIGEIGKKVNETTKEKIKRLKETKEKLQNVASRSIVKDEFSAIIEDEMEDLESKKNSRR